MKLWMYAVCMLAWTGLAGGWAWGADLKIATVDADRLFRTYHKTGLMDSHLEDQATEFTKEGEKMLAEHRRLKKEFEALRAEARNAARSDEARDKQLQLAEDKLVEVMEYESRIRETAMSRRQQIEDERRRMKKRLIDEIRDVIRDYAKEKGLTLVLDTSSGSSGFPAAIYAQDTLDITVEIDKILNLSKPKTTE